MPKVTKSHDLQARFIKKLESSGLNLKDAKKLKFEMLTRQQAEKLNVKPFEGFKIPYFDLQGKTTNFFRVRYLETTKQGFTKQTDKKEQRYAQPPDTLNEAYLPPFISWTDYITDVSRPIIITEGELKAAAATARGWATIGLGGVDCFRSGKRGLSILPIFNQLSLAGREVFIIYDSDAALNPNVAAAESALCRELTALGARPYIVRLPNILPGGKTGLDDYLLETDDDGFGSLLDEARANPFILAKELHRLNEEVVLIRDPTCIYEWETGQKMSAPLFKDVLYAPRTFIERRQLANGEVKATKVKTATEWLNWEQRAELKRLVYEPGQPSITEDYNLNLWKGWPCEPQEGDIAPWKELLDFVFAGEPESRKWFEQWCAYPLQYPGTKLFSACVIWGLATGTGKTLIGYTLMKLYGDNATEIGNAELESDDNDYAENKQFVVGEEITGGDKRGIADRLKSLVTRETVRINIKYVAKYAIRDCINYYFTSNHPDAFYLDRHDRRFFIHEVGGTPLRHDFYTRRYDPWYKSASGMSALFHHLLTLDLTGFEPYAPPPMTTSKAEMIDQSQSDLDAWVAMLRESPDTILQVNGNIIKYALYRAEDLLPIFSPDGQKNLTASGLARALKRAGFLRAANGTGCKCKGGQYKLWVIREAGKAHAHSPQQAGAFYESERELAAPKYAGKKISVNEK